MAAEWEAKRAEQDARDEARRQAGYRVHRHRFAERAEEVAAGNVHMLEVPAGIYLGRRYVLGEPDDSDSEAPPEERLRAFLGNELADQAMLGFVAVLDRDDLPSASQVAEAHAKREELNAEAPMVCGIAEMIRRGGSIDSIDGGTLAAAYMAWQRSPNSTDEVPFDIGPAIEAVLFAGEAEWEAHFRASIEPQLARNREHVEELHRLSGEPRFYRLGGRLAVEWLACPPRAASLHADFASGLRTRTRHPRRTARTRSR